MSDANKVKTPMLDRMREVQEESQLCGEFLEWLQGRFAMFNKNTSREEAHYIGSGDYINIEKILAEFFDIDLAQAEKGKRLLLESIRGE